MEKYKRALRRHHAARIKARVHAWGCLVLHNRYNGVEPDPAELAHWVNRTWQHPHRCSCSMCMNPRRSAFNTKLEQLTLQERRLAQRERF